MKFTPGPWTVEDRTQVVSGRRLVANTGGWSTNYESSVAENAGNAHLLAAAPEMYEALKLYQSHQAGKRGHYCTKCHEAITKALAKVEGK